MTITSIQDIYVDAINAAYEKAYAYQIGGRKLCTAHRLARKAAIEGLRSLGLNNELVGISLQDAEDIAELERNSR